MKIWLSLGGHHYDSLNILTYLLRPTYMKQFLSNEEKEKLSIEQLLSTLQVLFLYFEKNSNSILLLHTPCHAYFTFYICQTLRLFNTPFLLDTLEYVT